MTAICTSHVECKLIRIKRGGGLFENNVLVAELSVSKYLSRWTDSRSKIGSIRKRVPSGSSFRMAELKDSG